MSNEIILGNSLEDSLSKMYFYFFSLADLAKEFCPEDKLDEIETYCQKFKKCADKLNKESNLLQTNSFCLMSNAIGSNKEYISNFNFNKNMKFKSPLRTGFSQNVSYTCNDDNISFSSKIKNDFLEFDYIQKCNKRNITCNHKPLSLSIVDEYLFVGCEDGCIISYICDNSNFEKISETKNHKCPLYHITAFQQNNILYLISGEWSELGLICFYSINNNGELNIITKRNFDNYVASLLYSSADKIILIGHWNGKINIYNPIEDKIINTIFQHTKEIRSLYISDNLILSGGRNKILKIWDYFLNTKSDFQFSEKLEAWINNIIQVREFILTTSGNSSNPSVKIWKIGNEKSIKTILLHSDFIITMLNYDINKNSIISISCDGVIKISRFDSNKIDFLLEKELYIQTNISKAILASNKISKILYLNYNSYNVISYTEIN